MVVLVLGVLDGLARLEGKKAISSLFDLEMKVLKQLIRTF